MPKNDPRVDAYIEAAAPFAQPILRHLRTIVHAGCPNVEEVIKWGLPHFEYEGDIVGMVAFKEHCTFGFFESDRIVDPDKSEHNEAMSRLARITQLADLPDEETILGFVRKAAELNAAGTKSEKLAGPKGPKVLIVPKDLAAALKTNPKARKTFKNSSYTKRKEYIDWLAGARLEATRRDRLATAIERLAQSKSLNSS